jgi:serine/threonine protein kinase
MTKLEHENILRMKEVDWDATYTKKNGKEVKIILVVLELATGGELFEFLSYSGFFEEAVARTYFHQLIAGLEYCHSKGVVHRDLKPENLLLNEQFVLKLADFGFSNIAAASQQLMYTECGTPGYMAPEMAKGKGYDGFAADIWACGVILFIMLAGFPPFQKPNNADWWFNKLNNNKHALFWQAHSRSAYFSDQTKDFINKILNPDPTKRISIADMKKHPWWKGPTVTPAALVAELQRRKSTVDQLKEREKERKRQEQRRAALESDVVMRGNGELGEDISRLPHLS